MTTRSPASRRLALALCAAAATLAAGSACDGAPHGLVPTLLVEVWVSSPHAADQAVIGTFNDPLERFDPAPQIRHFHDPTRGATAVALIADWPMPAGETLVGVARLRPRSHTTLPTGRVTGAARSDFHLRESVDGYFVRLVPVGP
jgi:hypothetical protein